MENTLETKYTINTAPALTWNWLKSNRDEVTVNATFMQADAEYKSLPKGITAEAIDANFPVKSAVSNIPDKKYGDEAKSAQNARITTAAKQTNEELTALINETVKNPQSFIIKGKVEEPLILSLSSEADTISVQNIIAEENSQATVVLLYTGNPSTQIIQTKILAKEYAKLHIIKVQLLGNSTTQFDDTQIAEADNAEVHFTQLELGGQHVDSGLYTELRGYKAAFKSKVAYLCKNEQYLDMNHIVYHFGKKTTCDMKVNGTVKDNAIKSYRGTIDFKNGCCGSKGNEMEETLLLSPKAINKSLPVILCDEEDVEGEHGATIGRLSSEILFYMESRGISEKEAEIIMSRAKIQAIADIIPDDEIKNQISNWLDDNN